MRNRKPGTLLPNEQDSPRARFRSSSSRCFRYLSVINSFLIVILSIAVIVILATKTDNHHHVTKLISKYGGGGEEKQEVYEKKFTLLDGLEMTLEVAGLNFSSIKHYDICCYVDNIFVCRSVAKNVGVDCVIRKGEADNKVVAVIIIQRDMVGARCTFYWNQ